ncbi:MAG: LytR/AlgR family response regulator transcription factor [Chitinophagales bacterium]
MNCIIIEDQPPAQRILKKFIEDIGTLQLKATFSNPLEALEFLKSESVDLIFLDIHLPKISGIDFLKVLSDSPHIILTTAFPDYALESYEFSVVDYLLKPFSFQRFVKAISKIPQKATPTNSNHLFIKSGYEHIKITINDILYIQSDTDYTEIVLPQKKHISSEPLRYWAATLPSHQFVRIHKSYIINTTKIEKMVGNQIYLIEETTIPIGRAYKEDFVKRFIS